MQGNYINSKAPGQRNHSVDSFVRDFSNQRHKIISGQIHRRTEKAQTLMRAGLKRPARRMGVYAQRHSSQADIARQARAKSTPKHRGVNRFGVPRPPAKSEPAVPKINAQVVSRAATTAQSRPPEPLPSMMSSASHQRLERMLDQALTHADTHKQALRYHAARQFWHRGWLSGRRRWIAAGVIVLAIIAALSVAWQKVPALSVKMAGVRAHISPSVPAYMPDGYRLAGPARAVSGTVVTKFESDSDSSQSYEIVQAESDLTGQMVGQSVVPKGATVQTSQVDGNVVYIYGGSNNAAWVNNGILYTISDHANLNSDDLIKIVQGLNP